MNCSRESIEGYLDEELEVGSRSEVEQHLAGCQACAEVYSKLREKRAAIRSSAPYYRAPEQLRRSIRAALRKNSAERLGPVRGWRWAAIAVSVLLVCSLAWNLALLRTRETKHDVLAQSLIASHVRSLLGTRLLDVESKDQHTVKPWFNGKIDFSPPVKDLAQQGFALIGGRLEYTDNRTVAALVYRCRQHILNLFVWPVSPADHGEGRLARNGFNVLHWSDSGMTYWVISDIDPVELDRFRGLYQALGR